MLSLGFEALANDQTPLLVKYDKKYSHLISQIRDLEDQLAAAAWNEVKPLDYTGATSEGTGNVQSDGEYIKDLTDAYTVYLLLVGVEIVGMVYMTENTAYKDTVYVSGFVISKDHRRKGYASEMMDQVKALYKKSAKYLMLGVTTKSPAVKVYDKAGFKEFQKSMFCKI